MTTVLAGLFKHHHWANQRLFAACSGLNDRVLDATTPGTFGSILSTLTHIVTSEESYLAAITGEPPERPSLTQESAFDIDDLAQRARRSGERLIAVARQTPADQVLRGTRGGQPYAIPLSIFLTQAINHATEHRSQVMTILSQQGITPPVLDAWTFNANAGHDVDAGAPGPASPPSPA